MEQALSRHEKRSVPREWIPCLLIRWLVALLLAVSVSSACSAGRSADAIEDDQPSRSTLVRVGDLTLTVWLAESLVEQTTGLQSMATLPPGIDGLLFVFASSDPVAFHMRGVTLALDIWWFDDAGVMIGSARMEPCITRTCEVYESPAAVRWALETPANAIDIPFGATLIPD